MNIAHEFGVQKIGIAAQIHLIRHATCAFTP